MHINHAKILVVEDDEIMRTLVVSKVKKIGASAVEACPDGASALLTLAKFKPDLILTDVHMEPMGGLDFVSVLRRHPDEHFRKIKVIFMSADTAKDTLMAAVPLGVSGFIVKPPTDDKLLSKIQSALDML